MEARFSETRHKTRWETVMANSGVVPPRLPEPPSQIDTTYMADLVRTLELFITQTTTSSVVEDSEAISWFFD
jgi:hypothetical protein